jgi:hypothetical protein
MPGMPGIENISTPATIMYAYGDSERALFAVSPARARQRVSASSLSD